MWSRRLAVEASRSGNTWTHGYVERDYQIPERVARDPSVLHSESGTVTYFSFLNAFAPYPRRRSRHFLRARRSSSSEIRPPDTVSVEVGVGSLRELSGNLLHRRGQSVRRKMRVAEHHRDVGVSEELAHSIQVYARLDETARKMMP